MSRLLFNLFYATVCLVLLLICGMALATNVYVVTDELGRLQYSDSKPDAPHQLKHIEVENNYPWAEAPAFEPSKKFGTAEVSEKFGTTPVLNNGKKWRVVFYEGGPHANYYHYLEATILGLMKLGWIEKVGLEKIQNKSENTEMLWNWLANNSQSDYLEFVDDGYYSANWDDELRQDKKKNGRKVQPQHKLLDEHMAAEVRKNR